MVVGNTGTCCVLLAGLACVISIMPWSTDNTNLWVHGATPSLPSGLGVAIIRSLTTLDTSVGASEAGRPCSVILPMSYTP